MMYVEFVVVMEHYAWIALEFLMVTILLMSAEHVIIIMITIVFKIVRVYGAELL